MADNRSTSSNLDLGLKLRFRRLLFYQGYWTPIEVELSQYEFLGTSFKRRSLTDLDVLGIRYDQLFVPSRIVGDCKTGRISGVQRLFWLKGVKDYFGADEAYLIHPTIENHARAVAPKLGLRVLDEAALSAWEKLFDLENYGPPLSDIRIQEAIQSMWGIQVPKDGSPTEEQLMLKEVYSYLSYSYWYIEQHRNLLMLAGHFGKIARLLMPDDRSHLLLAYVGLERFAHSLLEASSSILSLGNNNVPRNLRSYIFGGPLSLRDRETLFALVRRLTGGDEQLDPPYLPDIIELVGRMIHNPQGASDLLRHLHAIYLWNVLVGETSSIRLNGEHENTLAIVLARDVADTFTRITGLRRELYSAVLAL